MVGALVTSVLTTMLTVSPAHAQEPNVIAEFRSVAPFTIIRAINKPTRARVVKIRAKSSPVRFYIVSEDWDKRHDLTDEFTHKEIGDCVWWSHSYTDAVGLAVCPAVRLRDGHFKIVRNVKAERWVARRLLRISGENSIGIDSDGWFI
jgi:hypothetical protein